MFNNFRSTPSQLRKLRCKAEEIEQAFDRANPEMVIVTRLSKKATVMKRNRIFLGNLRNPAV